MELFKNLYQVVFLGLLALLLVSCGGGGGGASVTNNIVTDAVGDDPTLSTSTNTGGTSSGDATNSTDSDTTVETPAVVDEVGEADMDNPSADPSMHSIDGSVVSLEVEPNNSFEESHRISAGTYKGSKNSTSDTTDYFSIIAIGRNMTIKLEHETVSTSSDLQLGIYNEELEQMFRAFALDGRLLEETIGVVPGSLQHLKITNAVGSGYNYNVSVSFDNNVFYEIEPNNAFETAYETGYETVRGYEQSNTDYDDYFKLTAEKSILDIEFKHLTISNSSDFRITVYDSQLGQILNELMLDGASFSSQIPTTIGSVYYFKVGILATSSANFKYELTLR